MGVRNTTSGAQEQQRFLITNVGNAPMSGVVGTDGTCDGFSVEGVPVKYALAPGQFIDITVRCSPFVGEGVFGCTVLISGSGVNCPSVTCTGGAQFPCNCQFNPTSVNFGDVIVGGQIARQFSISTGGATAIGGVMTVHEVCRWERGRRKPHPWIAGRIDLTLRTLEGQPAAGPAVPLTFFDATRWRRKPPAGVAVRPKTFGERLRDRRLRLGLSMEEVFRKAGTNRGTLYRLERGRQKPSRQFLRRVARLLGSR